jgi:hypothetical protein
MTAYTSATIYYIPEILLLRVAILEAEVLERYAHLFIDLAEKLVNTMRSVRVIAGMTR